jgi:cysteine desulfurase family protein
MYCADVNLVARYFDHAATSFPKPAAVGLAIARYLNEIGGPYGRSAYGQAQAASALVFDARERLAELIGASDSSRIAFTLNGTCALNVAIQGLARKGGKVLVSPLEHNSVMRPLNLVCRKFDMAIEVMPSGADGRVEPEAVSVGDDVHFAVCTLQSNVNGLRQPVGKIKSRLGQTPLIVDAAQGAGEIAMDVGADRLDLIAFTGHKGLLGPTGTGALYVREPLVLPPLTPGGTGSRSDSVEQPEFMPDALEGGTPNIAGIAGLGAALQFLDEQGLKDNSTLALHAIERLKQIDRITLYTAARSEHQGALFSFCIDGVSCSEAADLLYRKYGIAVRAGLHCAPAAHRHLGTFEKGGAVRVSFGRFHDEAAVDFLVDSIKDIVRTIP